MKMSDLRKLSVCSKHFRDNQYNCPTARHDRGARLKYNAVPTIVDCPNPPASPTPKRKRPADR